ncbi:MAG: hypothetical protein LBK95_12500 [Bifidobacteriaceae bacterium]|jgi:hypothetical protein|nr:hypothetical protein [Bifidobacteriaceae bacterium]
MMVGIARLVERMRDNPRNVRFADLERACRACFGQPRRASGSHMVFKMPWAGDPRVNIQNDRGMAKAYQVRQVIAAIDRLIVEQGQVEEIAREEPPE